MPDNLYDYEMGISDDDDDNDIIVATDVSCDYEQLQITIDSLEDGEVLNVSENKFITIANYTIFFHTRMPSGMSEITMKIVTYPMLPRAVLLTLESFTW